MIIVNVAVCYNKNFWCFCHVFVISFGKDMEKLIHVLVLVCLSD